MRVTALLTLDLEMPDGSPDDPDVRDALAGLAVDVRHRALAGAPRVRVGDVAVALVEGDVGAALKAVSGV